MSGSTAGDTPGRGWLQAYGHTPRSLTVSAIRMLHPRVQWHNPVLFVVMVCAAVTTLAALVGTIMRTEPSSGGTPQPPGFAWIIAGWLWLTLIAANVAESLSVGRGRSGTASLRLTRQSQATRRVRHYDPVRNPSASRAELEDVDSTHLRPSDVVLVEAGDVIPADGDVIWGAALVDESAITGESAPVIRECGGDRSAVTGGTVVLSDHLVVQVTARRGATAVDKMIRLAEGLHRQKAPNELALSALLASFSISFVLIALTVNVIVAPESPPVSIPVLAAMVACLIPTEIAALMSVTGTAGMYRLLTQGVLIDSAHALDLAGDITTVLLDKTGTITRGDRRARRFVPASGVDMERFVEAAVLASIDDPTPEGRSTLQLAAEQGFEVPETRATGRVIRFSAQTRMSGRDLPGGTMIRKGAESAVLAWLKRVGCAPSADVLEDLHAKTEAIATTGGTPLVVAIKPPTQPARVLGVIHCRDVVQPGMPERIGQLRALGIRTVMVTGDNPLTAQAIAADVGVDEFHGDSTPEAKVALIEAEQAEGHFVAMSGDGINDAPALAQADIGVAMNSATAAAKESANMVILDDDPTKLVEIVEIGRRTMATRGALTTFNVANDLVRYVALFPAFFVGVFPDLDKLNFLRLHSPASAVLSTVIFSVVVIIVLIPLALAGVPYRLTDLSSALNRNLLIYGIGGVAFAAVAIKLIDLIVGLTPGY